MDWAVNVLLRTWAASATCWIGPWTLPAVGRKVHGLGRPRPWVGHWLGQSWAVPAINWARKGLGGPCAGLAGLCMGCSALLLDDHGVGWSWSRLAIR